MNERNQQVHDAFQEGSDVRVWNRDGVFANVLHHTRQVRRRRMYRQSGIALLALVVVTVVVARWNSIATLFSMRSSPSPVLLDSISTNPPEAAVTSEPVQESATLTTTRQELPNLAPLLGQRSDILNDMEDLANRRDDLRAALNANPSKELASQLRTEIAGLDQMMASSLTTLRVVDNQIASMQGRAPSTTVELLDASVAEPGVVVQPLLPGQPYMYSAGISIAVLLVMFATMFYVRRTIRAALNAMTSLSGQATTQMSTLASGIEAVAIEVERLGESQRYMSKVLSAESRFPEKP